MSQYAKDAVRQRIIDTAREEFLQRGFTNASIRTITAKAKTSKSNLYNYFKDKNALFSAVLEPTVRTIRQGLELAKQFNVPKEVADYTMGSQMQVVEVVYRFVADHLTDVRLLLFQAHGSALEGFKAEILEAFTDNMMSWVKAISPDKQLSRFFVRSVCSFYLSLIEQSVSHTQVKDLSTFREEFTTFVYHGWKGILQS